MLTRIDLAMRRLPTIAVVIMALLAVGLIGIADWLTGTGISLSMFYIGPVALATWYASKRAGVVTAVLSIAVWLPADISMGLSFAHPVIPIWNAVMRFGFLFIIASLLWILRNHLEIEQRLARTDGLTGIANRRTFMEQLEYSLALAGRQGKPLTVTFMDLDDFKKINDAHGHGEGDKVLRAVANALSKTVRRTDIVARLGGDEFALVLPNTDLADSKWMLARVKRALGAAVDAPQKWTCSIGAVTFLSPPATAEEAVKMADLLMYDVKAKGKGRVAHLVADPRPTNAAQPAADSSAKSSQHVQTSHRQVH